MVGEIFVTPALQAALDRLPGGALLQQARDERELREALDKRVPALALAAPRPAGLAESLLETHPDLPLIGLGWSDEAAAARLLERGAAEALVEGQEARVYPALRRALAFADERADLRRAERALRALQEQSKQGRRMNLLGRLASGAAHDINNILCVVYGYYDLLAKSFPAGDARRGDVEAVWELGRRIEALVRHILNFGRKRPAEPVPIDVNASAARLGAVLSRLLGENVRVAVERCPEPCWVTAEEGVLEECLINLAVNARDAMPQGGALTFALRRAGSAPRLGPGEWVALEVRDTGRGMDEKTLARAFEPFFTTKPGAGSGLGLSNVLQLVRQMSGDIEVQSRPGEGTVFRLYLPASAPRSPADDGLEPARGGAGESVLLVEDDRRLMLTMSSLLTSAGYRVRCAPDAKTALAELRGEPAEPDLLLSDVVLPDVQGTDLARRVRQMRPRAGLVLTSGYGAPEDRLPEGALFLEKPFTPERLLAAVRRALDRPGAV